LLPSSSLLIKTLDELEINDKVLHVGAYTLLAFLPALHERIPLIVAAALGAAALGVALEFGQLVSGWRDFEVGDMIANAMGVCLGVAVGMLIGRMNTVRAAFSSN
jgi:glycopeptide antibiotics resistance protein